MLELIAFDADDTLWHNESHYTNAKAVFIQILSKYLDRELIESRFDQIEIDNIGSYGYGIKSFVLSMIEAAGEVSGWKISSREIGEILALGKQMLSAEVHVVENVEETLAELAKDYPLMLITKGDLFEQERKVARSGLGKYFRHIQIVGEKTRQTYQVLLESYAVRPESFLMVGNSLRSDILPVLEIGAQAVYVPYENTWAHENNVGDGLQKYRYFEINGLKELPELVRSLEFAGHQKEDGDPQNRKKPAWRNLE